MNGYHFSSAAQFDACLFDGADRTSPGLRPFAPYTRVATLYESHGAHAPAVTRAGEILWRDDDGLLQRLPACADVPEAVPAPPGIARAARIVATQRGLWVANGATLELYEEETLARLVRVELPAGPIIDIAGDGRGGVFALVEQTAVRVDCTGTIAGRIPFEGVADAIAFVYLRRAKRFVVLHRERLSWFGADGGAAILFKAVPAMRPCFAAQVLGSDGERRVFIAGSTDGAAFVLSFDAEGNPVGDVPLDPRDTPTTGIAAARDILLVTGLRGLLRFAKTGTMPDGAGEASTTLLTPVLFSPDREDARRWLRVEAVANLPEGTTIEVAYAATDDVQVRDWLTKMASNPTLTASQRIRELRAEPDVWRTPVVFHGGSARTPFAAPLFDVRERFLWVAITLTAAPGARLPDLTSLSVLYPGRTLMEHLPSIYQRAEAQPGSFLRSLVGVLETTTQELDGRIASMAANIHPSTAPDDWLDFVARWLGLPWDDALTFEQKQAIVLRAPELARGRGTRAGLEALLESLLPGTPRRFRVTDATADHGFAIVGGDGCAGSALPAMLGGLTRSSAELDTAAVLGTMRLPCASQRDDGAWQLAGKIRIDVAASEEELPWLLALIADMVPLTARVELRWIGRHALRSDRLGGTLTLEAPPAPHLGEGAVTGLARLPDRGARLSASGPDIGTRLR
ncbi:MAG TPA: phage tail protein [Thermoanaerobaculia bacterium]|nr:phage tail protein [Thermoanaerobaculia bacterium]